ELKAAVKKVVAGSSSQGDKVEGTVRTILKAVERGGDAAVSRYTHNFDTVSIKPEAFRITLDQMREAYYKTRKEGGDALRYPAHRSVPTLWWRLTSPAWMRCAASAAFRLLAL